MERNWINHRLVWLGLGLVAGIGVAQMWNGTPAEAGYAAAHSDKFSMCSAETMVGQSDAIFILDQATGRLVGATYDRTNGGFSSSYGRNLAADFKVTDKAEYVMCPANIFPSLTGGGPQALGGIYVAEMRTGICALYGFPTAGGTSELSVLGTFPWRRSTR
ncbi:MAG: hypothetical protein R3C01_09925 [Planctomycetaceae bacterium]